MTDSKFIGKVYCLFKPLDTAIYIGSTTKELQLRLQFHMYAAKACPERKVYKHFGDFDGVQIVLLEELVCSSKRELVDRERAWYDQMNPTLNDLRPSVTHAEALERRSINRKAHYQANKQETRAKDKIKYANLPHTLCGCGAIVKLITNHVKTLGHKTWVATQAIANQQPQPIAAPVNDQPIVINQ